MNILIPHQWLLDHLDTQATPKEIQKYLSLCGPSVERIYDREGEQVYDIEVTTNRVDSMSVRGIAREAAVILNQFGIKASLKPLKLPELAKPNKTQTLPFPKVSDPDHLCYRKIGLILRDVNRSATPAWMAKRLTQVEINIHESVIDITNYITHDLGHPCHAFDYDKLMATGGEIIVTEAKPGLKMVTLDGEEYKTLGGEIVFVNAKGEIIDLPAIKGTANTSVDKNTKNILLWMENLPAKKVRQASMGHAIRTVAAQLSEKHVDPHLAEPTIKKAIQLYQELTNAQIASPLYDDFSQPRASKKITLTSQKVEEYLGLQLPVNKVSKILTDLGCQVEIDKEDKTSYQLKVSNPSFRPDLNIPVDLIEEIARIYGYHNLPSVVMPTRIPLNKPTDTNFHLEEKIKHLLADLGWQEVYTYSMVSEALAEQSGKAVAQHLKLQNPLTEDRVYLRQSLIPSLVEALEANPLEETLSVFELANIYLPKQNDLPTEDLVLALASKKPYREVKGYLEVLFATLFLDPAKIDYKQQDLQAKISWHGQDKKLLLGEITYLVDKKITAIQLNWPVLVQLAKNHPTYQPLAKTSMINEDMTFELSGETTLGKMIQELKHSDQLITEISLKDTYQNRYTLSFTYHNPSQNLSKEQIEPLRKKIVKLVEANYSGHLIGQLN